MDKGDYKNSLKYYELFLERNPNDVKILNDVGTLFVKLNNYEKSLIYFRKALKINFWSHKTKYNIASVLIDTGRYEQAKTILNKIIEEQPDNFYAYSKLGEIHCNLDDFYKGIKYFHNY